MSDNNTKRFLQCLQGNRENVIYLLGQLPSFFRIEKTFIYLIIQQNTVHLSYNRCVVRAMY